MSLITSSSLAESVSVTMDDSLPGWAHIHALFVLLTKELLNSHTVALNFLINIEHINDLLHLASRAISHYSIFKVLSRYSSVVIIII